MGFIGVYFPSGEYLVILDQSGYISTEKQSPNFYLLFNNLLNLKDFKLAGIFKCLVSFLHESYR